MLDPLDAPRPNDAHDAERPVACPPSPASRQPRRLLAHPSEMTSFVRPGLRLDRDGDPAGRDRHRVDVSPALPRQRMPQPPALRLQRCERALDGVLRAGPDPAAASEREPVAGVEPESERYEEHEPPSDRRTHADERQPPAERRRPRPPRLRRLSRAAGTAGGARSSSCVFDRSLAASPPNSCGAVRERPQRVGVLHRLSRCSRCRGIAPPLDVPARGGLVPAMGGIPPPGSDTSTLAPSSTPWNAVRRPTPI